MASLNSGPFRALEIEEIAGILGDFRRAAQLALEAGFDGVELHGANGYLVDQFLQDGSNKRIDAYGGSIEHRARFLIEALGELIGVFGADRVGLRLSPEGQWGDVHDSDPRATFGWLAERLSALGLGYLHIIDPRIKGDTTLHEGRDPLAAAFIRKHYDGTIIAAGGFDGPEAKQIVEQGDADFVAFARWFSSNPDLPERLRHGWPFTPYQREAFWGGNEQGYSDFLPYRQVPGSAGARRARRLSSAVLSAFSVASGARPFDAMFPSGRKSAHVSYRRVHHLWRARSPSRSRTSPILSPLLARSASA